jgi:hypothetical protein
LLAHNHREADARVAARRFDDGLAGLQLTEALGALDDRERHAILHGGHRIEGLDLHIEVDPLRRESLEPDQRRVADGAQDAAVLRHR